MAFWNANLEFCFPEILEIMVPQGYFLAITPGTKFITLRERLHSNIHGKITMQKECFRNA